MVESAASNPTVQIRFSFCSMVGVHRDRTVNGCFHRVQGPQMSVDRRYRVYNENGGPNSSSSFGHVRRADAVCVRERESLEGQPISCGAATPLRLANLPPPPP